MKEFEFARKEWVKIKTNKIIGSFGISYGKEGYQVPKMTHLMIKKIIKWI